MFQETEKDVYEVPLLVFFAAERKSIFIAFGSFYGPSWLISTLVGVFRFQQQLVL